MIEAMIQTGAVETAYRRAGAGTAVLILSREAGAVAALFPLLAERFRVILPAVPAHASISEDWLRGIIDGLGLQTPAIVVEAPLASTLLRFAMMDPGRVGRLAILDADSTEAGNGASPALELAGSVEAGLDALSVSGHPLMVARLPADPTSPAAGALMDELVAFLAGATPQPRSVS